MDLTKLIDKDLFNGIIVVPDLHNNIDALNNIINYAFHNKLFILSLGDLVDGEDENPFDVVLKMRMIVEDDLGFLVFGNHDEKYVRMEKGNPIVIHEYIQDTLDKVGDKVESFLECYKQLFEHRNSGYYAYFGNWYFCHASPHYSLWENPTTLSKAVRSRLMYGCVSNETDENGLPFRWYTWVDDVPADKVIMVGHDRCPMGNDINGKQPFINTNKYGAKVFFMDTGSGKSGHLTTAILQLNGGDLIFSKFKRF